ncbi:hypothetical protein BD410DRAFT_823665 [Rickenella mellea]|uniref:Exonuclease domain-containing protein n=1 Tax=Rickenella mellea TaxID=50990 RepID=A0A4R5XEN7_9AGAM|nr:hypothetical protein BD410DRAFT_823665 [Rickenella mellea]
MFSTTGHFQSVPCPNGIHCKRPICIFSHSSETRQPHIPQIPTATPVAPINHPSPSTSTSIPFKRPAASPSPNARLNGANEGPPRKLQKVDSSVRQPTAGPAHVQNAVTPSITFPLHNGVPILRVNPAQSRVAVPVRQAMLKTIYEHFASLYEDILPSNPNLAAEHALAQEENVYNQSTKLTYRNAMISSIASLKKRPKPNSLSHDSVGTDETLLRRKEQRGALQNVQLTSDILSPYVLSREDMKAWGYIVQIPDGPGGDNPSDVGKVKTCERCKQEYRIQARDDADICIFHWGRPYSDRINGDRVRIWKCCSRIVSQGEGCERGPHVFSESEPAQLHSRYPFSPTRQPFADSDGSKSETALDIVVMDCEMVYTTGGIRVARVSVLDGSGKELLDELVKMDDGVEVIDFNTRFSGVTEESHSKAKLSLAGIRRALDSYINSNTIVLGHALENDLKTLRMIHHRCVDTAILFPHRLGLPYRRALRDLAREHLNEVIQAGGEAGHSSVEDSIATLNLVRWFVLNKSNVKKDSSAAPGVVI